MVDKYNTDFMRRLEDGPIRGGGVVVPCICEEGAITVYGSKTLSDGRTRRAESHFAFATEIEKGDFVSLTSDAAYTYDLCDGMPVVLKTTSTNGINGIVLDDPRKLVAMPATSGVADTIAKRIAAKYYRVVMVWFPAFAYKAELCNAASPNVTMEGVVTWDVDSEVMVLAGSGGLTAAHVATTDSVYIGVFWGMMTAGDSQD